MFKAFLGNMFDGRLDRLNFISYNLLLMLLPIGFAFYLINFGEKEGESILTIVLLFHADNLVFWIPFLFISSNLMAKRFRDIDASGWTTTIIVTSIIFLLPESSSNIFTLLIYLVLIFLPSKAYIDKSEKKGKLVRFIRGFFKFLWILVALVCLILLLGRWAESHPDYPAFLEREKARKIELLNQENK